MHPSVETRIANNDLTGALRALSKVGNTWQKELSKKLLSLNLTTVIGYDKQENFAHRLVNQNVDAVRNQLLFKLEEEFPSVFKKHFANLSDIRAVYKALTELKDGKLGIPKETIQASIGQIEIVEEAYKAAVAVLDSSGTYFPHADALTLNRNRGGNNPNTFLHEILHAATHYALDPMNFNNLSAEQKQAVQELERTYKIAKELWGTGNEISSIDEFIVEAFTNPDFQRFLKDIPMPNQQKTIWNKFTLTSGNALFTITSDSVDLSIITAVALRAYKGQSGCDPNYVYYPNYARAQAGGPVNYKITLKNLGNIA